MSESPRRARLTVSRDAEAGSPPSTRRSHRRHRRSLRCLVLLKLQLLQLGGIPAATTTPRRRTLRRRTLRRLSPRELGDGEGVKVLIPGRIAVVGSLLIGVVIIVPVSVPVPVGRVVIPVPADVPSAAVRGPPAPRKRRPNTGARRPLVRGCPFIFFILFFILCIPIHLAQI